MILIIIQNYYSVITVQSNVIYERRRYSTVSLRVNASADACTATYIPSLLYLSTLASLQGYKPYDRMGILESYDDVVRNFCSVSRTKVAPRPVALV